MEKVYLDNKFSSTAASSRTRPRSSGSDAATVSSRWKEASERKPNDKTDKNQRKETSLGSIEDKNIKKNKSGKIKQPTSAMAKVSDPLDDEPTSSPFDLLSQLEGKGEGSDQMISVISIEDPDLDDKFANVFSMNKKKTIEVIDLHQGKPNRIDTSVLAASLTEASEMTGIQSTGDDAIGAMISDSAIEQMEELMNKLADEISVLTVSGKTETTIELKNTPLFNGAKVTLTEFDSAKKEFNIKFENLSTRAHEIISMQSNRETLKSALEQRGYNVHIITANTEIEQAEEIFKGHQDRSGSDKHDEQQGESQQQHQQHKQRRQ